MRRGQFFIISAVLIAGALLTITTIITASENVDYNAVLERHDTAVVENVARTAEAEWWDGDWNRRKTVTVEETAGEFLENESVPLVLDAVDARLNDTCAGIRVLQDGERRPWVNTTPCGIDTYGSDTPDAAARYKLDEGSGTTANDSSGNGNDGTLQGDPQWVSGRFGNGLLFDGSDDYVQAAESGTTSLDVDELTVSAWVRPASFASTNMIVNKESTYEVALDASTGELMAAVQAETCSGWCNGWLMSGGTVPLSTWSHVAVTWDGEGADFYIDGSHVSRVEPSEGNGTINDTDRDLGIAARDVDGTPSSFFDGTLDDVRIYPIPLSGGEVEGIAQNGIGLNISLDVRPEERTSDVYVYYESFRPPHPNYDGSSMVTTAGTPDVVSVGPARGQQEIQTKLDRYVDELDAAVSPSIDFVPRENRCDLIVFRATRAALQREVC